MSTQNGGPAFPAPDAGKEHFSQRSAYMGMSQRSAYMGMSQRSAYMGMSLRDYFAAKVIGHLSASPLRQEMTTKDDVSYAYVVADAMLEARKK